VKISRRGFLKALGHVSLGYIAAGIGAYKYGTLLEPEWLTIEQVMIHIPRLKPLFEGFRIVQMSDFHLHPYTQIDHIANAVDEANRLKPDLVVLTGDFVLENADSIYELAPVLSRLNAKYGVFSILGNHDLWTNASVVRSGLEEVGLPVLKNNGVSLSIGRDKINLAGLDAGWGGLPDLKLALRDLPPGIPTILLMHEPDFADIFSQDKRVSLQLSGHTHGGQVRIPVLGAPVLPKFGKKYDSGLYRVNEMWLYTNHGIGVIGPPVRLNCRPEITEITLVEDRS
jgi:predicted MPP superfamily phosphohydrolase